MAYCYFELKDYNSSLELNKAYLDSTKNSQRLIGLYNSIVCCRMLSNYSHEKFYSEMYKQEAKKTSDKAHCFFSTIQLVLCKLGGNKVKEAKAILEVRL